MSRHNGCHHVSLLLVPGTKHPVTCIKCHWSCCSVTIMLHIDIWLPKNCLQHSNPPSPRLAHDAGLWHLKWEYLLGIKIKILICYFHRQSCQDGGFSKSPTRRNDEEKNRVMGKIQKCYKKSGCYWQRFPELIKEKHLLKRNVFVSHKSETMRKKIEIRMNEDFVTFCKL